MKSIFLASFFLFLVLFLPSFVAAQSPPIQKISSPTINIVQPIRNDIDQLSNKIEKLLSSVPNPLTPV